MSIRSKELSQSDLCQSHHQTGQENAGDSTCWHFLFPPAVTVKSQISSPVGMKNAQCLPLSCKPEGEVSAVWERETKVSSNQMIHQSTLNIVKARQSEVQD
jgi:hypothetical protein